MSSGKIVLDVVREPRNEAHTELLGFVGRLGTVALLVVRRETAFNTQGQNCLDELSPWLIESIQASSWPGTQLLGHTATLHRFRIDERFLGHIGNLASGLFDWQQPDRPEDLCVLRSDGSTVLETIAHERNARLYLTPSEWAAMQQQTPQASALLRRIEANETL